MMNPDFNGPKLKKNSGQFQISPDFVGPISLKGKWKTS